jgi:iron complex outermembrane receptor protein
MDLSIRFLLVLVVAAIASAFSPATIAADEEMEELITLGSRGTKPRSQVDSAVPVDVFSSEKLREFGQTETSRMLQMAAPSFNFSTSTISDGTDIVRPASLRGMQPDQTLVLVNGKRRHSTALMHVNGSIGRGTAGVDLNAIPPSSIARIEVLRDGAAAQYGSDAIAGVINIVLKDQTETIDPFVQFGSTYEGDGDQSVASLNAGFPIGAGFINLTGEYRKRDATNRAGLDQRQQFNFDEQVLGQDQLGSDDCGGPDSCTPDSREDTANRLNHRYGDPDSENVYFTWNAGIPLGSEAFELYTFGTYASREGQSGGFFRRDYDGRSNPLVQFESVGDGSDGTGFLPLINSEVDDTSAGLGLEGLIGSWSYDASVVYGKNEFEFIITNSNNVALGPTVPGDPLTPTSASAGTLETDLLEGNLDFSNEFDVASGMTLGYGAMWRQDGYKITEGELTSYAGASSDPSFDEPNQYGGQAASGIQVFPGFRPANAVDEDRNAWGVYADLETEITDRWLVDVAARYEDYDDFGDTTNFKIATRWFVVDNVALRASASTGFRAPSLQQQFFNNLSTQFVGVPVEPVEVGTLRNDSDAVRNGFGIPALKEEQSNNLSAGFTWTPTDAFSLTADAYYIEVDDRVVLSGRFTKESVGNDGLDCDGNPDPAASNCPIQAILPTDINAAQFFSNAIDTETSGIDLILDYNFEWGGGLFGMNAGFNWTNTSVTRIRIPDSLVNTPEAENTLYSRQEVIWMEEGQPKDHYVLTGTYSRGPFSFLLRGNWFGEVKSTESTSPSCESDFSCVDQTFAGKWLMDLRTSWAFNDNIELTAGADNIFDTTPDQVRVEASNGGIFPYSRRTTPFGFNGAFYYVSLNMSFGHGL